MRTAIEPRGLGRTLPLGATLCLALGLGLALAGGGCGSAPTGAGAGAETFGPHGGPVVALPGDAGFAEVLVEPVKGAKPPADTRVVVYFLKTDLASPLGATPADVTVKLRTPDAPEPLVVAVTADARGGGKDPAASSRFASKPGPYSVDQIIGEISCTVDGSPFSGAFARTR